MPPVIRLPLAFDVARLRADLDRLHTSAWTAHMVRQNYRGDWDVLPLRIVKGATHPVMMIYADPAATAFEDGPLLAATPYLRDVLAAFACPLQTVRLMRLSAGSVIKEHRDHDLDAAQGMARIHVPITTNDAVDFRLNGIRVVMPEGSAWYLRLADPHSVVNAGDTDRVHLVIDCEVNDWLRDQLRAGA
ncbi:aspartyl/asparaginyl beta-hydroxylase domain-containing protein [Sphingomonas sp. S1-29]|uniref:aspartyl/asparaginyl beta-hydroxylase domain-containing protein n=1 Tax=Sphingomonas sp. S1-29 TaxID=2991074 RepID=UPI0022405738|nr:aspartyl/asparaginyl beta-hydroxylase domain-containing protein [Sphingomonas sp. S1-29]UZK68996.1 aspartyl/asparaginyl beta-hydroxylase domain-containing protein [Sphingomonas sp. S1-29]